MDLTVRHDGRDLVVTFERRVNLEGEGSVLFKERLKGLIAAGHDRVVLDLGNVGFIDSQGLGALISALKVLRHSGGALVLANISEPVEAVLRITRLIRVFEVRRTVEEARLAAADPAPAPVVDLQA